MPAHSLRAASATLLLLLAVAAAPRNVVTSPNPARYNEPCVLSPLRIGHDILGFEGESGYVTTDILFVRVAVSDPGFLRAPDAYVYETRNGLAFLGAESRGRFFRYPDTVMLPLGRADRLSTAKVQSYLKPQFAAVRLDMHKCFTAPWNGRVPNV